MPRYTKRKVSKGPLDKGIQASPSGGGRISYWRITAKRHLAEIYDIYEERIHLLDELEEVSEQLKNAKNLLEKANQFISLATEVLGYSKGGNKTTIKQEFTNSAEASSSE